MIPFAKPLTCEKEQQAVIEVLSSGQFVHGKHTQAFEEAFAERVGVAYAVALSNCTAGLFLSLQQLGIGKGDKVIIPAMTHVATAHAVRLCGADPLFIDVCPTTGNINTAKLSSIKDPTIKAIIPVHYLGLPVDMAHLCDISLAKNWTVIEDCALALDASFRGKNVGSIGLAGCFSFYPTKHITSIEGGMLTTSDADFAKKIRVARAFGYDKMLGDRKQPGVYNIDSLGGNFRMDEVRAAVGQIQLQKLDDFLFIRNQNFQILEQTLRHVPLLHTFPRIKGNSASSHYCFNIVLPKNASREHFMQELTNCGIGYSVHYPQALPLSRYYKELYPAVDTDFPVATWLAEKSISLPVGPHISKENAHYIADNVASIAASITEESVH